MISISGPAPCCTICRCLPARKTSQYNATKSHNRFFLPTMKTAILFALPVAISAAVITSQSANGVAPVFGIDKLVPVIKKNAQRTLTKFGRQ